MIIIIGKKRRKRRIKKRSRWGWTSSGSWKKMKNKDRGGRKWVSWKSAGRGREVKSIERLKKYKEFVRVCVCVCVCV